MTGIFYVAQEDVDFQGFGSHDAFSPSAIAVDGVRARTGSSANVCATYSVLDRQSFTSNIGQANSMFNGGATLNNLSFSCRYYVDGGITGSTGNEYFIKFDNFAFSNFTQYSIVIKSDSGVYLWDNTTSPVLLGTMSPSLSGSTLQKLDIEINYQVSGTIKIWLGGALAFNYSGDLTSGAGPGSGFYSIDYGSGGGTGTGTPTYWSEIIVADSIDIKSYYVGYTSTGNSAYEAIYCDYGSPVATADTYGYTFSYPISVTPPPYYVTNDIVQAGFASVGAGVQGQVHDDDELICNFTLTNAGGTDTQYTYDIYFQGNPNAGLSQCLPRTLDSITGFNMLTQSNTGASSGPSDGTYGISKFLTHFVFGVGTPNPCIMTAPLTNVMILT